MIPEMCWLKAFDRPSYGDKKINDCIPITIPMVWHFHTFMLLQADSSGNPTGALPFSRDTKTII